MMGKPDIEAWFYSLDLEQLMRMFTWPSGHDANEFIDDCDEAWADMGEDERMSLYDEWHWNLS